MAVWVDWSLYLVLVAALWDCSNGLKVKEELGDIRNWCESVFKDDTSNEMSNIGDSCELDGHCAPERTPEYEQLAWIYITALVQVFYRSFTILVQP